MTLSCDYLKLKSMHAAGSKKNKHTFSVELPCEVMVTEPIAGLPLKQYFFNAIKTSFLNCISWTGHLCCSFENRRTCPRKLWLSCIITDPMHFVTWTFLRWLLKSRIASFHSFWILIKRIDWFDSSQYGKVGTHSLRWTGLGQLKPKSKPNINVQWRRIGQPISDRHFHYLSHYRCRSVMDLD